MNRLFILTAVAAMIAGATGCECTRGCRQHCNPCQPACAPACGPCGGYGGAAPPFVSGPTDPYLSTTPGTIQATPAPETYVPAPAR